MVLGYKEYIWAKELGQETHEGPTRQGGAPYPLGAPSTFVAPPTSSPSLLVCFWSKKDHREIFIPFGLRLVFLFCETLKQAKKQQFALGLGLVG